MKFYPADWQADQALRSVGLAARCLWLECMCIMHRAEPYGHLVVNGRPVTDTLRLAALTAAPPDQVLALMAELESAGVLSRNRDGVIFSRRMTRDDKQARTAQRNGKRGGNPNLLSHSEDEDILASVNPPLKPVVKGEVKAQMPDKEVARRKKQEEAASKPERTETPTRELRSPAGYAFKGSIIRLKQDDFDRWRTSYFTIPDLAAELRTIDAKFVDEGYAGKWFGRASAWLQAKHEKLLQANGVASGDDWKFRMTYWRERHSWVESVWGPEPGQPGCQVPAYLLGARDANN